MKFEATPSFYNDEESFNQYIGFTSYYRAHQGVVANLVRIMGAKKVLEYGCAGGHTCRFLVDHLQRRGISEVEVTGVDVRPIILEEARKLTIEPHHQRSVRYLEADMETPFEALVPADYDFTFFLYSFHHIQDPLTRKQNWLREQSARMRPGSWLAIADFFLPEDDDTDLREIWARCAQEAGRSTRYNILETIPRWDAAAIAHLQEYGDYSFRNEYDSVELILQRQNEYLIKRSWLRTAAAEAGLHLEFEFEINEINDAVFLFQKKEGTG